MDQLTCLKTHQTMPFNISEYPYVLDKVLSFASWATFPALRTTSKDVAKFTNPTLWNHVAIKAQGSTLAIMDPFTHSRIPGLRLEGKHTAATLRHIVAFTSTIDLIGDADALRQSPLWPHFRRIAETKRLRATHAICHLLSNPSEVIAHYDLGASPHSRPDFESIHFQRLFLVVPITQDMGEMRPNLEIPRFHRFIASHSFVARSQELILVLVPGDWQPPLNYSSTFISATTNPLPYRPLDIVLYHSLDPLFARSTTFVGLEWIHGPSIDQERPQAKRALLEHLGRHYPDNRDRVRASYQSTGVTVKDVSVQVASMAAYPRSAGINDYEWTVLMTEPGVKLPFPPSWPVNCLAS